MIGTPYLSKTELWVKGNSCKSKAQNWVVLLFNKVAEDKDYGVLQPYMVKV